VLPRASGSLLVSLFNPLIQRQGRGSRPLFPFRLDGVRVCLKENDIEPPTVDMERHGAVGGFRMCAGLMLRRHALKVGHVVIGGKKNAAPGAKKHGRKAKSAEAKS